MLSRIIHTGHHLSQRYYFQSMFSSSDLKTVQSDILHRQLAFLSKSQWGALHLNGIASYREFTKRIPLSTYSDWQDLILEQKSSGKTTLCPEVRKYMPTSGSTEKNKWVPYSKEFLKEMHRAVGAWIYDVGRRYPRTLTGKHYWSLSWVPDEQRQQGVSTDDSVFLSLCTQLLHRFALAVPFECAYLPSCEESLFTTVVYLASTDDLSLISVWSPSFLLELLRVLSHRRVEISEILRSGKWSWKLPIGKHKHVSALLSEWNGDWQAEFFQALWPRLALISAWDSSTSQYWAQKLQEFFPHVAFQGKGLWATEGVITIPIGDCKLLASRSHFYEFQLEDSSDVLPAWELEAGMKVEPILTTSSGLLRYQLNDLMTCEGSYNGIPCLDFKGRLGGTDMVGEKLDRRIVTSILQNLRDKNISAFSLIGILENSKARYELLVGTLPNSSLQYEELIAKHVDDQLREHFHYNLARDLGQLDAVRLTVSNDPLTTYMQYFPKLIRGNIKLEELTLASPI